MIAVAVSGTAAPLMFVHLRKYASPQIETLDSTLPTPLTPFTPFTPFTDTFSTLVGEVMPNPVLCFLPLD